MKKKNLLISCLLIIISIVFTLIVKNVDVNSIGPNGSSVGLSGINNFFHNLIGVNMFFYILTDILGYIAIIMVVVYGIVGCIQLVNRKSLLKVDKEILLLGGFYACVLIIYVFFEKVIINYRPTLIDGVLEASYPSSHTMLSLCICGSTLLINNVLFKRIKFYIYENKVAKVLMISILFGRIISGVHWFTDILGGVIISITLLYIFKSLLEELKKDNAH